MIKRFFKILSTVCGWACAFFMLLSCDVHLDMYELADTRACDLAIEPQAVVCSQVVPAVFTFESNATISVGNITAYSWKFSNGTSSSESSPTLTFADAGEYTATLTVDTDKGVSESRSIDFSVSEAESEEFCTATTGINPATSSSTDIRALAYDGDGNLYGLFWSGYSVVGPISIGDDLDDLPVFASTTNLAPSTLFFDDTYLYEVSDQTATIYRASALGGSFVDWVYPQSDSVVLDGEDKDPCWGSIAPEGFDGTNVSPGDVVIVDRSLGDNHASGRVYCVNPDTGVITSVYGDYDLSDPVAGAFGKDGSILYIADEGNGLYGMDGEGNLTHLSLTVCSFVAVNPKDGAVYFGEEGTPMELFRYVPSTGSVDLVYEIDSIGAKGFSTLGWGTMVFTPDGSTLLIPDTDGKRIVSIKGF